MAKDAVKPEASKKPAVKKDRLGGTKKYFRGVVSETKKVNWPSRKELVNYTMVVIAVILVFAVVIGIIDLGLGGLLDLITHR